MSYNRRLFLRSILGQPQEFADNYAVHRAEQEGICWNDQETWWVCDDCKSASENLVDFKHEQGCKYALQK